MRQGHKGRVTIHVDDDAPLFEAIIDEQRWNGWAAPRFTEAEGRRVAEWTNRIADKFGSPDADRIVVRNDPVAFDIVSAVYGGSIQDTDVSGEGHDVVEADEDGLFAIGSWVWCWEEEGVHFE